MSAIKSALADSGQLQEKEHDAQLLNQIKSGDNGAWGLLYQKYRLPTIRFAYKILHNAYDSEDVAQDVFIYVKKNPDAFIPRTDCKVRTLIMMNTRHRCLMRIRESSKREFCELPESLESMKSNQFEIMLSKERKSLLRKELDKIPSNQNRYVKLWYFYDLGPTEISGIFGATPLGIKSSIHHGLMNLRKSSLNSML